VAALSHLLTKKFNNLGEEFGNFLDSIVRGHYNFEKREIFDNLLRSLTKDDLLSFYDDHIYAKPKRKQFSLFVLSSPKSSPDLECTKRSAEEAVSLPSTLESMEFSQLTTWKASQRLLPLPRAKASDFLDGPGQGVCS
jgi:secreted Zn-dependent insulinase-like peptidase